MLSLSQTAAVTTGLASDGRPATHQLPAFINFCQKRTANTFRTYSEFDAFAIHEFRAFWSLFLEWSGMPVSGSLEPACDGDLCETAKFFPNVELNYAEALLTGWGKDSVAVTACHAYGPAEQISR
ncbi:acetoacetate--CoA ligase family protein, partial [Escherichia coli]|uniref:acetoacetate--CoA ligase family protein n=1 Tax=Escherichia coli TaxID=562 RepID=UPI00111EDF1B